MAETSTEHSKDVDDILSDTDAAIDNQIDELKIDYQDALSDKPEISKHIESLRKIIRKQQKKLNKFYKKLKDHKFVKKVVTFDKEAQTDNDSEVSSEVSAWGVGGEKTILQEVTEVAENALKQTSFAYEPISGMYYDFKSGYYYDAKLRMYFDGNTGNYVTYDQDTKRFQQQPSTGNDDQAGPSHREPPVTSQRRRGFSKDKKSKKLKLLEMEEGEVSESSENGSEMSDSMEDKKWCVRDGQSECKPCMRIIVVASCVPKVNIGALFVVTCKGGSLGREGDHLVLIPHRNVSKHHANFSYSEKTSSFYIVDLGSRNGTWLRGERLSSALQESERVEITHGSEIQVGSVRMICHIHEGKGTCHLCEPGLMQAKQKPSAAVQSAGLETPEYRVQLRNLKKKFGVKGSSYSALLEKKYLDRAERRRTTVGSSHSAEKTQASSTEESIPQTNKGYKMLSKMGWNKGQGLGRTTNSIIEPLMLESNPGTSGLGAAGPSGVQKKKSKKSAILEKTVERFNTLSD